MKPHPQASPPSLPMPSASRTPGETEQPKAWNWHLDPQLWARSVRQQLNTCLRFILEERNVPSSPAKPSVEFLETRLTECSCGIEGHSWDCWKKQKLLKEVVESEQRTSLELLLSELQSLLSAVLQDCSCEAWRYLHAVLGLLPPYREMLTGQLELLPLLEQLYCWAPKVQSQLHLDLLDAIDKAFPPDTSLLHSSSHVDCRPWMKRSHRGPPCPACPFVKAQWGKQQKQELATWLRPLTLPELQHSLGIVGVEVALEETQWLNSLSLLPLALATDIPVQYGSSEAHLAEREPAERKSQRASESLEEKAFKKKSSKTSLLKSKVKSLLKTDWYQSKIHFLYLNVAPDRYFRPYNLVVVPPNQVNPEHYIFSPFGILHVHPVEGSETMTLGTWHRNSTIWHELQRIPFFKNCLLQKALTCWKKNVRLHGLHRIQTFLKSHLLLAVPHFGAGLLHISRLLQELRSVSWLPKEPDKSYELMDLQKTIAKENHRALRVFCHFLNLCTSILQLVHEDTYQMQQGLQERVQNWNRIRKGQGSIYLQRVLCRNLEKKLKQAETWLLKLGKLARMIDYMICQNLVSILEEEITSFIANTMQVPRENPFLLSQLVFDDNGRLSPMPCVETIIQSLTKGLQAIKTSALKVVQSTDMRTSMDPLNSEDDKDQDSNAEFLMPKFHGKPSDAVHLFCGPNVGFVWPWKSHAITNVLEVRGHRLRGQYLHTNYNHVQEDLDNNTRIQQALAVQQTLLEDMLQEVREFCSEQQWVEGIYKFLKAWDPQKLENLRGSPIKDYVVLVSQLKDWQERVSNMPVQLLTKGKLLLLSGHDVQAELESKLSSMRKNILAQVQSECWSRNRQLMTEMTDFLQAFQAINSDIHVIAQCSQKLNEANEQYGQLEERVEYVRSLHDIIRNHCGLFMAENETLDISLLDIWETFQFERSQASEFLLSKRHSIVPKLQQLMAAALTELEDLLAKALSGSFMDPSQEQRSTEQQLAALEHQFLNTLNNFNDLRYAYNTFTGDECTMSPPTSGNRPIIQQQRIWRLYRIISENFSEWKCMAFTKFSLTMAREKTDAWLTEAARLSTTLGLHSPVLQRCMRMLEDFRNYLPLLTKLGSLQPQNFNCQSLLRVLGLGGLQSFDLVTLGQLLNCPLLEFADRINQVWQYDKERIHAQESLQQMQQYWEGRQLRLLNFILHVPYKPPVSERSKRLVFRNLRWELVGKDSGTFLLSDYSSLQDAIQNSLQALFKILAIQKSGELNKIALEWVSIMYGLGALLEVWVAFQQKWIFLNKVLHEMKIQFPGAELNARFKVMDDQYRTLMRISVADPMVLSLIVPNAKRSPYFQGQHLQQLLKAGSVELEAIIMALENVLYGGGAWLLLENVHQLPPSLLSALGQRLDELHHLYAPLYQKASQNISTINPTKPLFIGAGFFEKHHVFMRLGYGCFLTFHDLSADVPANLHLLLRPVALALPDLHRVAELYLLGAGVKDASRMATRLSKLFSLERELVSGTLPCRLSLLKQVLEDTVQTLNAPVEENNSEQPDNLAAPEEAALLQALLHSPLFSILDGLRLQKLRELLCGIFPNASHMLAEPVTHRLMRSIVVEELQQVGLLPTPNVLMSLEQLSQALSRASGILLLGPAGSGKSSCWKSLFKIQNRLAAMEQTSTQGFQSVEIAHLYPSVLSSQEFLGWSEGPSWHYGIFPKLLHAAPHCKNVNSEAQSEEFTRIQQWIVCDGTPNPTWIDSITCLLSDPPQLSLPNGQQIARPLSTFFLMEVAEAAGMSPTVVGRCALVWYCGEQTWQCMLNVLMASLPHEYHLQQETVMELNSLAEVLVPAMLRFLTRIGASSLLQVHGHQPVCPGVAEVASLARILRALLDPHLRLYEEEKPRVQEDFSGSDLATQSFKSSKSRVHSDSDGTTKKQRRHLLAISSFLFATIWGFGAHLPSRHWPLFDNFMRNFISSLSNYPEPPPSALVFDLHVNLEDGTLVPFAGQYLSSCVKGNLGTFQPSSQTERLLYVVNLLLSDGQPVLLAGEIATGKSAFVQVLVEPSHPSIHSPIHSALSSAHLRHVLSRGVHGQTQAAGSFLGYYQDSKGSLLFLMEDLHLASSDPEKSCQPVLETLRQAMEGTIYARNTLELQTLQPTVNFLATATVPGYSERPLCPRLFRLFTVLALDNMSQDSLLRRHVPSIQAWLERFPSVEREHTLARALVRASVEAWEAVCNCFMPSPLRPHYRFSLHSVSHILESLQLLPTRMGSRGFVDSFHHQEHLRLVSGLRGTRLTIMMSMRVVVRLWLHEAQRTFCDRLNSDRERSHCAKLLLEIAQSVFCCGPESQPLVKDFEEEVEEEKVPEVESEGEIAQWEDLSSSDSESEEEKDPYGLQVTTGSFLGDSSLAPLPLRLVNKNTGSVSQMAEQEEEITASFGKLQSETPKSEWQTATQMDFSLPLLLPVLLFYPQEKPSDLVFSLELTLGSNPESPNLYLERQWETLEKQLAASAVRLKLNPHLTQGHMMTQHVARLVRVLARHRQHGLLLSVTRGTGRHTAVSLASSICQAHLFHLPSESEEAIFQCLRDASWCAGVLNQPVALLVPETVNVAIFHRLVALATSGSFPDQYTEADLDNIEEHLPKENPVVKLIIKKDTVLHKFYQQVCSNLHMFFLMGDDQAQKQLPSTLFLKLLQLTIANVDRYEPWDQASLVRIAQYHLEDAQSLPLDDGSLKCPDIKAFIPNVAKIMALIHLSSACYHQHVCPALPLVTPKTFLDFLDMFLLLQQQMVLKMRMKAQRIHSTLRTLRLLAERHSTQTNLLSDLEMQLKGSYKNVGMYQSQLEESKLLYKQKMAECQHHESLIENLVKQQNALQAQQEAFLDQMGKAFLRPLSQLQVADFEEIRSYRAPPDSVVQVTDALCELFHHETGWANAKQLLCTEDFYQELVFFPKEKLTESELIKLNQALKAPGMRDAALRSVSIPAANLAIWLWAVLRYGLAQRRGLPTGLLLRQVEATLAREQARLGKFQFQAHDLLEQILSLTKKLEDALASHNLAMETFNQAQCGQDHKWPMKSALLTPMDMWTKQLQKMKNNCKTVFGDALLCSAAIVYLGPFPPQRRQELLEKWLSLCQGFEEALEPDDVAQTLKQKSVGVPPKNPLVPTCTPFRILTLLSCGSEQQEWDRDLKPQARSARLLGLLLRSHIYYRSYRWPLLLDPSNQALAWLNPLPQKQNMLLAPPKESRAKYHMTNQDSEDETEDKGDNKEEDEEKEEDRNKANGQTKEQKTEENKSEEGKEKEEQEAEKEKNEIESLNSSTPSETQSPPPCLTVLSGADPELGPQLLEAASNGLPVLLTNMELSLRCQELRWLLSREDLSPPHVQPGFCLYLSTTLPIHALERVLGCELLKGLNVLDLGLNMEILEEQMLHEILCRERPELETRWQDLKIRAVDTYEAMMAAEVLGGPVCGVAKNMGKVQVQSWRGCLGTITKVQIHPTNYHMQERLLAIVLLQNQRRQKPSKFLREMVRTQAKICQLNAQMEEIEEQKLEEMVLWAPYRQVACHGIAVVEALSSLQKLLPFFCMNLENWLTVTRKALGSMKPHDSHHGEDFPSHLLQLKIHLTRQLLSSTVAALGLTQAPLVGALGAIALLQVTKKTPKLERLALWPGLSASPSIGHNTQGPGMARPAWLGLRAWQECGALELLSPFAGLRASLAGHSSVWQDYLSLSSTVLGPAPGPNSEPLSLFQKLILWRVLRPDCLAAALADLTTSLLGRPLDEDLGAPTMIFEHSQATQPILILLPPSGHPIATLHPVTVIRKLAANHETQKDLHVIALGSEDWDPVSTIVNTLCQAMLQGHWLVLDNCHLMPHWPRELLQPLLGLLDGAKVVSDSELLAEPENRSVATVHRDFRLWLIVSTEASASLPGVLIQHSMTVFWDQSLELRRILIDSVDLQQGLYMQPFSQTLPLFLLHGLLLHRQLYGIKLQAHRGRWSQVTLTKILQTQEHLRASLSNPGTALLELAASVFYGGSLKDPGDREALISLTRTCLDPKSMSWVQPHTPQYLLATLMPNPELGELDARTECKARMHLLPTPAEPRVCGLNEGPKSWLLRRQSRALLSVLQQCSPTWVPSACGGINQRKERRLRQRLVQAKKRLVALQALLSNRNRSGQCITPWAVLGPNAHRPLEGFLETEVLELKQLVCILQRDLDCLLQQLKGETPCASSRCAAVAHALWAGRLPRPWRSHAPAGPQLPWQWLRQLSRRGHLLIRYLDSGTSENANEPERIFHLSAFRHPRRLFLALRWEAVLKSRVPSPNLPGIQGSGSSSLPPKRQELNNHPLHIRVSWHHPFCSPFHLKMENGPNPKVPEMGLLLIGLQLHHAEWDQMDGALQDSFSSQPSLLPPVSVSTQARGANNTPVSAGLGMYSCPVYMTGPLGTTKLHSKNILMHLPLPTKLSLDTCIQRRVHVCSPALT
ncbi:dynein heavy chain domain-containing protein 1 isoform X4 [Microtus pennsylvanicus]|uniref:dynein heavy chain domain-containing protein 1 isoform X4 n=1 Tax=Microtus pennsylvanicus TaxID=10058 RepID=UPI003F6BF173